MYSTPAPRARISRTAVEQACHVVRRQRRRWLVHDDDAGVAAERTRDLDELLFGHREVTRRPIGIDLRPGAREQRLRDPAGGRPSRRAASATPAPARAPGSP